MEQLAVVNLMNLRGTWNESFLCVQGYKVCMKWNLIVMEILQRTTVWEQDHPLLVEQVNSHDCTWMERFWIRKQKYSKYVFYYDNCSCFLCKDTSPFSMFYKTFQYHFLVLISLNYGWNVGWRENMIFCMFSTVINTQSRSILR